MCPIKAIVVVERLVSGLQPRPSAESSERLGGSLFRGKRRVEGLRMDASGAAAVDDTTLYPVSRPITRRPTRQIEENGRRRAHCTVSPQEINNGLCFPWEVSLHIAYIDIRHPSHREECFSSSASCSIPTRRRRDPSQHLDRLPRLKEMQPAPRVCASGARAGVLETPPLSSQERSQMTVRRPRMTIPSGRRYRW